VDDNDMAERQSDHDDIQEDAEVPAAAVVASGMVQGNMESGNVGALAATLPGYIATHDLSPAGEEPDDEKINFDALEAFGSKHRETGDEGVSDKQSELEADELSG
jgi:hypothetical protein